MSEPAPARDDKSELESRISSIESALEFDERLRSLETRLQTRVDSKLPWYKSAARVTVIVGLIAAAWPAVTTIDGILKNRGESQRLLLEQQDKIRQTYLDRVLKPGTTEGEQQRVFGLLVRLKSDPEFQEWATEEYNKANKKVEDLIKEKQNPEEQNTLLTQQLDSEKQKGLSIKG